MVNPMKKQKSWYFHVIWAASLCLALVGAAYGQSVVSPAIALHGNNASPQPYLMRQVIVRGPQPSPSPSTATTPNPSPPTTLPTTLRFVSLLSAEGNAFPTPNIHVAWTDTPPSPVPPVAASPTPPPLPITHVRFGKLVTEPASSATIPSPDGGTGEPLPGVELPAKKRLGAGVLNEFVLYVEPKNVKAGLYTGKLLMDTPTAIAGSESIELPLTISIRDNGGWAVAIMALGIGLSTLLTWYFGTRQPLDTLLLDAGRIEAALQADPALTSLLSPARVFYEAIERKLSDMVALVAGENTAGATTAFNEAQALYNKWNQGRDGWFRYLSEIKDRKSEVLTQQQNRAANAPGIPLTYLSTLLTALEKLRDDTTKPDTTSNTFSAALKTIAKSHDQYKSLWSKMEALPDGPVKIGLAAELDALPYDALTNEVDALRAKITAAMPADALAADAPPTADEADTAPAVAAATVPSLSPAALSLVRSRQILLVTTGYIVALILLFIAGFYTLYVQKPTFGSDAFLDYSLLFGYGFGVTALSRPSALGAFTGWRLAGLPTAPAATP